MEVDDTPVQVGPARPEHLEGVAALADLEPATRRLLVGDLRPDAPRHAVVATATGGTVVGFAMVTAQADAAHVLDVVVDRLWRRRGVATALLRAVASVVAVTGTPALTLEVRAGNEAARRLYSSLGFEDVGTRTHYYRDGEDAHILWHHDPPGLAADLGGRADGSHG